MKCIVCKIGETENGQTTVTLRRDATIIVLENVEAKICDNCGHYYLDSATSKMALEKLNAAVSRGTKLEVS
jgi:YgiT-type zinc finger domain-containing protein